MSLALLARKAPAPPLPAANAPVVAICTPSFRRRGALLEMVEGLRQLTFTNGRAPHIKIVIVDNSPEHELADLADRLPRLIDHPVQLAHEPVPGLAAARNRLLKIASETGADFIAFIDDDERPDPTWLDQLLAAQEAGDADIVTGTVIGTLPPNAPAWMAKGRFFDHIPGPTYRGVSGAHTATTLVRVAAIIAADASFEETFAFTGGEDTMFFTRLERAGAQPVQAHDAVVYEKVPVERARLSWLWRRWMRTGSSEGRLVQVVKPGLKSRLYCAAGGLARVVVGFAAACAFAPMALAGRAHLAVARLKTAARGVGFFRSALDRDIAEYARQ